MENVRSPIWAVRAAKPDKAAKKRMLPNSRMERNSRNLTAPLAELVQHLPAKAKRVNVGAFLNSLNQSLARIQQSGVPAVSERRETDSQIVLTITIPKT